LNYINQSIIQKTYKTRKNDSHKGDHGKILCIGGSEDYSGAPYLAANAAIAALRTGVDIITIAAPEKVAYAINALNPDIISKKFNCIYFTSKQIDEILKLSDLYDCILIGPGIGQKKSTSIFINEIIQNINKPIIIDADAIKCINLGDISNTILTPHIRELEILLNNSNISISDYTDIQGHLKSNVLLIKDNIDTIISNYNIQYNKTGNPGMTTGGTGDVLSGIVSGFVSQGNSLVDSACAAAYLSGYIGDELFKNYAYSFIASDFLDKIGPTIKKLIQ